jgi:hypothetical protein
MRRLSTISAWLAAGALLVAAAPFGASDARAANAIGFATWDGGAPDLVLDAAQGVGRASDVAGLASSYAGNPFLQGSAWAHTGDWWSLYLGDLDGVRIRVEAADAATFAPGLSLWAIGDARFDGGTTSFAGETAGSGFGTPHTFNATGALGSNGTLWMQQGQGGNAQELLGVAIAGPTYAGPTGWGETVATGVHASATDPFVASVSGLVGAGFAELQLTGVKSGWYLLYVGGTDHAQAGGLFDLVVVPEPSTSLLLALGLGVVARRRSRAKR